MHPWPRQALPTFPVASGSKTCTPPSVLQDDTPDRAAYPTPADACLIPGHIGDHEDTWATLRRRLARSHSHLIDQLLATS